MLSQVWWESQESEVDGLSSNVLLRGKLLRNNNNNKNFIIPMEICLHVVYVLLYSEKYSPTLLHNLLNISC